MITNGDSVVRKFLVAGQELLLASPGRLLDGGLPSEHVVNAADSSPATFYRKFDSRKDYLAKVRRHVVAATPPGRADVRAAVRALLDAADGDRETAVRDLVRAHFARLFTSAAATHRLLAAAIGVDEDRGGVVRTVYRGADELVLQVYEVVFAESGVTLRKPFTAERLAITVTALVDGFLARYRAEPKAVPLELVTDAVISLLAVVIDTDGQHNHIDDVIALGVRSGTPAGIPDEPRRAMVDAARAEFTKRGYFTSSIETMAAAAQVPTASARKLFPTKAHVIVWALKAAYDRLAQSIEDDLALDRDVPSVLEQHLLRLARLAHGERPFMDALVAAVAHDTYAEPDGMLAIKKELNLPALAAPLIAEAQRRGVFTDELPAGEIAALLTNTLLLRCFTRRESSAEENAAFVTAVVLDGVRRRP